MSQQLSYIAYQTIHSSQIYLNSSQANQYVNGSQKSNVIFNLSNFFQSNVNVIEVKLSLVNAQIPYSFYQIDGRNNKFIVNGISYYIPTGNYNIYTLITSLLSLLPTGFNITFSQLNNKLVFTYTSSFTIQDNLTSAFSILGFSKGSVYTSTGNTITAPYPFNLNTYNRIHLATNFTEINNADSFNNGITNILGTIPITVTPNDVIFYENKNNFKAIISTISKFSDLQINFYDDNEIDIDFNNQDWTVTLQVDVLKENFIIKTTLEDFLNNSVI